MIEPGTNRLAARPDHLRGRQERVERAGRRARDHRRAHRALAGRPRQHGLLDRHLRRQRPRGGPGRGIPCTSARSRTPWPRCLTGSATTSTRRRLRPQRPDEGGMHLPDIFVIKPVFADGNCRLRGLRRPPRRHRRTGAGGNAVDSTEIFPEGCRSRRQALRARAAERKLEAPAAQRADPGGGPRRPRLAARRLPRRRAGAARARGPLTRAGCRARRRDPRLHRAPLRAEIPAAGRRLRLRGPHRRRRLRLGADPHPRDAHHPRRRAEADFAGTSPQVRSALNATPSFARRGLAGLSACSRRDIPSNGGFHRPISVAIPGGGSSTLGGRRRGRRAGSPASASSTPCSARSLRRSRARDGGRRGRRDHVASAAPTAPATLSCSSTSCAAAGAAGRTATASTG